MRYTRQQGARDTGDYLAAVAAYLQGTVGQERADALALWQSCDQYAMEQRTEWPCEIELHAQVGCRGATCDCAGSEPAALSAGHPPTELRQAS